MAQQVTCITKRGDHHDPHQRISHIGGDGWRVPETAAIAMVKADLNAFYVETPEGTAFLVLRQHDGREYLTTEADGIVPDNLLTLPECA
jgi:Protein of unknown function (DUF3892)